MLRRFGELQELWHQKHGSQNEGRSCIDVQYVHVCVCLLSVVVCHAAVATSPRPRGCQLTGGRVSIKHNTTQHGWTAAEPLVSAVRKIYVFVYTPAALSAFQKIKKIKNITKINFFFTLFEPYTFLYMNL